MRSKAQSSQTGQRFLASTGFPELLYTTDISTARNGGEMLMSFSKSFLKRRRKK